MEHQHQIIEHSHYRWAYEHASIGLAELNSRCEFIHINPFFVQWLGYSLEELRQMTLFDVTHPEDIHSTRGQVGLPLSLDFTLHRFQKRLVTKSGQVVWGQWNGKATLRPGTSELIFVCSVEDITDLKKSTEFIAKSAITTYNHEINNPLSIAIAYIQRARTDHNNLGYLKKIEESLWRVAEIVKKISALTDPKENYQ